MRHVGWTGLRGTLVLVCLAAPLGCHPRPSAESGPPRPAAGPLAGRTQLVTVVTGDWDSFRATLRRYEREGAKWQHVGAPVEAVIGRAGYGWGYGLHGDGAPVGRAGPEKREGDGKSPAGVFAVGAAYGYAESRPEIALPYTQATAALRCVDDPGSRHYNAIVSTEEAEVDWRSAEHMQRDDELYVLTVVVEHNRNGRKPHGGSCIFFHLWNGPDEGMSGCTAMSMEALDELAAWLRPGVAALVALPQNEYEAQQRQWGLPPNEPH